MENFGIISWQMAKKALKKMGFVGSKPTILTNLQAADIVEYDATLDAFVNTKNRAIVELWTANTLYKEGEMFVFDEMIYIARHTHTSANSDTPELDELNNLVYPITTTKGYPNVIDLQAEIKGDGGSIEVTWINPVADSYEGREVFYSPSINITNMRYDEVKAKADGADDVYVVAVGLGSDQGNPDSALIENAKLRTTYYTKAFVQHYVLETEEMLFSLGRFTIVENRDIYPPSPVMNLVATQEGRQVSLTWAQPTDEDFLYTKVVRSQSGMPITPNDGVVVDVVSGAGHILDTIPTPGVTYYYKLFTFDDAGPDGMQHGVEGNWNSGAGSESTAKWTAILGYDFVNNTRTDDAVGMSRSDFDDSYPWSYMARCVVDNDGVVQYYLDDNDSSLQEDGISPAILDGTDGQVVVEIPEFYYAITETAAKISNEEFLGSVKFDRSYVGFAEASENEGELVTAAGTTPVTLKGLNEFRNMAPSGWQLMDVHTRNAVKALFMVEYAGLNSQMLVGSGVVGKQAAQNTGSTLGLGNTNGAANGSVSYRGLENLWGNTDEIVEGLIATDTAYYTATGNFGSFVEDGNTGSYTATGSVPIVEDGYVSAFGTDGVFVGSEVTGNSVDFTGDHQYSHKTGEINMVVAGGNYQDGTKAGLFRLHMGLTPFGREDEMTVVGEFDKVIEGEEGQSEETVGMTFVEEMQVDGEDGFYFTMEIPDFSERKWFRGLDKIEIKEVV